MCVCLCVCARTHLCLTLCDPMEPHQVPLSMRFSRQEYWSRLSFPTPGDLLYPGIEPESLMSLALAGGFFTTSATWEAQDGGGGGNKTKNVNMSVYNYSV